MHLHVDARHPSGAGRPTHVHHPLRGNGSRADDIGVRLQHRPILSADDYWQLQNHRRRFEELGAPRLLQLARLIRAKSSVARIVAFEDLPGDIVTGRALITYAIGRQRPVTRRLYHWNYPARGCGLPVGSALGVRLIGMSVGQRASLDDGEGGEGELRVIAVHEQATPDRALCA